MKTRILGLLALTCLAGTGLTATTAAASPASADVRPAAVVFEPTADPLPGFRFHSRHFTERACLDRGYHGSIQGNWARYYCRYNPEQYNAWSLYVDNNCRICLAGTRETV